MGAMMSWYQENYGNGLDYSKMIGSWMLGIPEQHKEE